MYTTGCAHMQQVVSLLSNKLALSLWVAGDTLLWVVGLKPCVHRSVISAHIHSMNCCTGDGDVRTSQVLSECTSRSNRKQGLNEHSSHSRRCGMRNLLLRMRYCGCDRALKSAAQEQYASVLVIGRPDGSRFRFQFRLHTSYCLLTCRCAT